jgi:hypothetical protein
MKIVKYICFVDTGNTTLTKGDIIDVYIYDMNDPSMKQTKNWMQNEGEKYIKMGISENELESEDFKGLSLMTLIEYNNKMRKQKLQKLNG